MSAERNCPRKHFKSIRKTVWKTRKRIRKTIRNAFEKCLAPLRPLKNISPALFNQILKVFHRPKFAQKKVFFHREALQGWPRQENHRETKIRACWRTRRQVEPFFGRILRSFGHLVIFALSLELGNRVSGIRPDDEGFRRDTCWGFKMPSKWVFG